MNRKTIFILLVTLLLSISLVQAQNKTVFGIGGGISKATGEGSEYWKMGFNIGGEFFQKTSDNIQIGGRVAYNKWSPDDDEIKSEFSGYSGLDLDISASASIIELVPTIRFISSNPGQQVQVFGQFGFGYYILKMDVDVSGSYMGYTATGSGEESENKFGMNFGAGIVFGDSGNTKFSIYPMYNIVFTEEESTKYFTVNVGILFGN